MSAPQKYPPEVRDRAIRLVDDVLADDQLQLQLSVTGACRRVGEQLGINRDTLRGWGEAGPDRCRRSTGGVQR
jgi:transposase